MNRCPITYEWCGEQAYSTEGLKLLSPKLIMLKPFPFTREEQVREAVARASKLSIQGVQPKLSIKLNVEEQIFDVVDTRGTFIVKPQHEFYQQLPENEDLTMRMAKACGIEVPLHGMMYSKDKSLSYFIKRFDRLPRNKKVALEDFAQLSGETRETKYRSSMEKVSQIIEQYCTFPLIEKQKLFHRTLFSYLCGNEDMHLKKISLIRRTDKIELSPAYDLVNTTIAMLAATEELALSLAGKKSKITREQLVNYFGKERLKLTEVVIIKTLKQIEESKSQWLQLIVSSFLSDEMKKKYKELVRVRWEKIYLHS